MPMKRHETKRGSSSRDVDSEVPEEPKMDIKSILKDMEFLGKISLLMFTLTNFTGNFYMTHVKWWFFFIGKLLTSS